MEDSTQIETKTKTVCDEWVADGISIRPKTICVCVSLSSDGGESAATAAVAADRQLLGSHPIGIQGTDQRRGLPITPEAESKIGESIIRCECKYKRRKEQNVTTAEENRFKCCTRALLQGSARGAGANWVQNALYSVAVNGRDQYSLT